MAENESSFYAPRAIGRRTVLKGAAAGVASGILVLGRSTLAASSEARIKLGSCMIGLEEAKKAGLDGVEVRVGDAAQRLEISDPAVRARYKVQMKDTGLVISSLMMGLSNSYPLASDPRGPAWLDQSIDAAKDLGAKLILVAFFGKGDLREGDQLKRADVDAVVRRIKAAAGRAQDAGVILAIENTLSARQNAEILDRIGHKSVRIYYDVGNSTDNGYDVPAEIRFLKDKIASFHFKDNPHYFGQGKVKFPQIVQAIDEIGYNGWIVMENVHSGSKDRVADAQRNAKYVRTLFGMR